MLEVLQRVIAYTGELQEAARIDEARVYVSTTGPSRDTLMLFGNLDQLAALLVDDEFEAHIQDGVMVVRDLDVALWAGGVPESLSGGIELHVQKLMEHGLI